MKIKVLNALNLSNIKKIFFISINTLFYVVLLFTYRVGSTRVEGNNPPGLRDFGCYISPGRTLVTGNNPYLDTLCATRYGTLSLFPFGLFDLIVPRQISVTLIQCISLIGIQYFVYVFCKSLDLKLFPAIALIALWLSSVRENLVVAQATGLFLGLSGYVLNKYVFENNSKVSRTTTLLSGFILAFLIDIKPHSFGFFVLFIVIHSWKNQKNRYDLVICFISTWVIGHILIDLYVGKILEVEWIHRIFGLFNISKTSGLPESIALWPLLEKISITNNLKTFLSYIFLLILFVFLLLATVKRKITLAIYLSFLAPSYYVYYHHYDMVPIIIITLLLENIIPKYMYIALIEYVILPIEFTDLQNLTMLALLLLIFYLMRQKIIHAYNLFDFIFGTLIFFVIHLINLSLSNFASGYTMFMTELILCFTWLSSHLHKKDV